MSSPSLPAAAGGVSLLGEQVCRSGYKAARLEEEPVPFLNGAARSPYLGVSPELRPAAFSAFSVISFPVLCQIVEPSLRQSEKLQL